MERRELERKGNQLVDDSAVDPNLRIRSGEASGARAPRHLRASSLFEARFESEVIVNLAFKIDASPPLSH